MARAGTLLVRFILALACLGAAWTLIASLVFLGGTHLLGSFAHPFYQWWTYLLDAPPNPVVTLWLRIGAGAASVVVAVFALALPLRGRTVGPSLRPRFLGGRQKLIRGTTDNHGHADWLPIAKAREIFPGPSPEFGGVVVGEAYRVDQDSVAHVRFDPRDKTSWGRGGKAPLLIDPCTSGPTHSLIFAGTGAFKSTCAVSTLLTWTGSAVVLDPSGELGPMLAEARAAMGHAVHQLDLRGGVGFNVLDWIDIASPLAATNVLSVVGWICGDAAATGKDKADAFFEARGRALVACLLSHMLWDPDMPPALKTLRSLRVGLATPEKEMRTLLSGIHKNRV
jgi:type IV secretion system protein VirD4